MAVQDYKINYKSDFVLTINGDAGWAVPFCIKFWTGMPSQAYFVGFDGVKYVNCRVGDTPTQLLVMFDDHHLPIGKLEMQIAYHTTIEEFPGSVFDEVTNARDVIVTIDGTDYQVMLDFTGEDAPELEFDLPAYANEAERIQNELQRQQNEADRIAAELQREQATTAAVQGAENVNAQLNGTTLTVTNRQGVSTSVNTKGEQGEQGPVGPEGPQGEQGPKGDKGDTGATGPQGSTGPQGPKGDTGVSINDFVKTGETETDTLYDIEFSDGTTKPVAIPKGEKGDQGEQGPEGPQGPMGDVAVITPEQQAAFTMYSETGQNTNGPMTQKAVTDALVAGSISYDNSQSGLVAKNVQGALDEVSDVTKDINIQKETLQDDTLTSSMAGNVAYQSNNTFRTAYNRVVILSNPIPEGCKKVSISSVFTFSVYFANIDSSIVAPYNGLPAVVYDNTGYLSARRVTCDVHDGTNRVCIQLQTNSISNAVSKTTLTFHIEDGFVNKADVIMGMLETKSLVDTSGYPEYSYWINDSATQWASSSSAHCKIIPVHNDTEYELQVPSGKTVRYVFLKTSTIQAGSYPSFCDNYYGQANIKSDVRIKTPSDCNYLYCLTTTNGDYVVPTIYSIGLKTRNFDAVPTQSSDNAVTSGGVYDALATAVGTVDIITYNGTDFTLTNGYINKDGIATVPSNVDWRKVDEFIPIPEGATEFSFEDCARHHNVADIAFYSAQSESSFISAIFAPTEHTTIWSCEKTPIPSEAKYYRLSFVVLIGEETIDLSTQKYSFYVDSLLKNDVERLVNNIGFSYEPYGVSIKQTIMHMQAMNYEYLYIPKGTTIRISQNGNSPLNIYSCVGKVWDRSNYQAIQTNVSANPFTYTFQQDAGCVRIYNNGSNNTDVTLSFDRDVFAKEQIKINQETIDRLVDRVGGLNDSFGQIIEFREPVTGSLAKMWTSDTLTQASKEKEWLVIMCHGNGILIDTYDIPSTALDYFRANKINVATIQYQDLNDTGIVGAGFNKYAWGNDAQFAHVICLYNYLQSHYNFHKSVVLAGCSMGGLVMGAFAYKKPFPIAFCLGLGVVPSLMTFWTNGNESRKEAIRAAYDMPTDGSGDANAATYFQGHDWWNMGMLAINNENYKIGFPNVYLYYGNDATFRDLFGGTAKYSELCQALKNGGVYSKMEQVGANNTVHDTSTIWTQSVVENIWHNELGVPSYEE
jgi:hypothetical protein